MFHVTFSLESIMSSSVAARVQKHRDALRAAGMRPVQIWVPDTRSEDFARECRRQSLLLRDDPHEADVLGWLASASDAEGWK
jgi:hypothetical protein